MNDRQRELAALINQLRRHFAGSLRGDSGKRGDRTTSRSDQGAAIIDSIAAVTGEPEQAHELADWLAATQESITTLKESVQ